MWWLLVLVLVGATAGAAADECTAPELRALQPRPPLVPPLAGGRRPSFVVVLTDDQGFDDLGLHHPAQQHASAGQQQQPQQRLRTPNLDAFLAGGVDFRNYYTAPFCALTRAQLLTGRDFARTGTVLNHGGFDYLSRDEVTMAKLFRRLGYKTAHYGKWHNGRSLGYEPWHAGFEESWLPFHAVMTDNLMRHNGHYAQTHGMVEARLVDLMLSFIEAQAASGVPFLLFYAPMAVHRGRGWPANLSDAYRDLPTAEPWGRITYLDEQLGRLFSYLNSSSLAETTFVLVSGDNGPELRGGELEARAKQLRMPSRMVGSKDTLQEGGIRGFLTVRGPGVPAGLVDDTLLSATDVLPTLAALAGPVAAAVPHPPWDGLSFAHLLAPGGRRTAQQAERTLFELHPTCVWSPDSVLQLGPDRRPLRPQPMLDYDAVPVGAAAYARAGAAAQPGVQRCLAARYRDFKWMGASGKVWRLANGSHVEAACNEVSGAEQAAVAARLSRAARAWWASLVAEPHSFSKPVFQLGLPGWSATNVLAEAAHERTPQHVQLETYAARGFKAPGDRVCYAAQVWTPGSYAVDVMAAARVPARFRLSVGAFSDIEARRAPSLLCRVNKTSLAPVTFAAGLLQLPAMPNGTEVCFELVSRDNDDSGAGGTAAAAGTATEVLTRLLNLRFTLQRPSRKGASSELAHAAGGALLEARYAWPPGQARGGQLESMFSPLEAEAPPR